MDNLENEKLETGLEQKVEAAITDPPAAIEGQMGDVKPAAAEQTPAKAVDDKMIPKERLDYVLEQKKASDERATLLANQLEFIKQQFQANNPAPAPVDPLAGIPEEGYVEAPQVRKVLNNLVNDFRETMSEMHFRQTHPDFDQVVGTPGQMGESLKKLITEQPELAQSILQSKNNLQAKVAAYQLAKTYASMTAAQQRKIADVAKTETIKAAEQKLADATRTVTIGATPGSAGLNAASRFATMTDEEIQAEADRVKEG